MRSKQQSPKASRGGITKKDLSEFKGAMNNAVTLAVNASYARKRGDEATAEKMFDEAERRVDACYRSAMDAVRLGGYGERLPECDK